MNLFKTALILVNLVLLLGYINWSIASKEKTVRQGRLVLLELAPVDPRSLMQGDYMRLNYKLISNLPQPDSIARRGLCAVVCNAEGVATGIRLIKEQWPLRPQEVRVKYFAGNWQIRLGAESYFFEEGQASKFAATQYGGLRVDAAGNSVLTGLYDSARHLIVP